MTTITSLWYAMSLRTGLLLMPLAIVAGWLLRAAVS